MDYTVPPSVLLNGVPSGIEGTRYTLALMRQLARQGMVNTQIRQEANRLTLGLPQKDWTGEVQHLFQFVRDQIRYVGDVHGVETLHTAERVLNNGSGDCDDKAILLAAMLKSINHGARFHAVALRNPNRFEHVFVEAQPHHSGPWIALDPTVYKPMGWSPADVAKPVKSIIVEV